MFVIPLSIFFPWVKTLGVTYGSRRLGMEGKIPLFFITPIFNPLYFLSTSPSSKTSFYFALDVPHV